MTGSETTVDVVIVGAGLGGIASLQEVRSRGYSALVLDAASGPGGTWYWNRYPGARCDIESRQYSYGMFPDVAQEWTWSEKFATQEEILQYLEYVVDSQGLRDAMRFNTRVTSAHFEDATSTWLLTTESGDAVRARYCIMATGTLSTANLPAFPGIEDFAGEIYHTGLWPHEGVDLAGKRVGVIGTGSSGVQVVPQVAEVGEHMTLFMRTPYFVVPARNRPLDEREVAETKAEYPRLREQWKWSPNAVGMDFGKQSAMEVDEETRQAVFERAWEIGGGDFGACFNDLSRNSESTAAVEKFFRNKIAELVQDPQLAEALTPTVQWGTRRLCVGSDFYETFNRPNVSLVDLRKTPIERVTKSGMICGGVEHELDMLILATGFDAVTGTLLRIDIRGRGGVRLADEWREGPRTYLGMALAGFPNLFLVFGPQSPGTLINMAPGAEMHAEWIGKAIAWADANGVTAMEPSVEAQDDWVERTNALAATSPVSKSDSWWTGANIPGKPRGYLGYIDWPGYVRSCNDAAHRGYAGFVCIGGGRSDQDSERELVPSAV